MKKIILIAALLAATGTTAQAAKATTCGTAFCPLPRTEAMAEKYAENRCKTVFHLKLPSKAFEECVKQKKEGF